jgi:uncharacterized YccA/Bax inhibitor family protein
MGSFNKTSFEGHRRTSNPVMRASAFERAFKANPSGEVMTLDGAVNKIGILLFILVAASLFSFTATTSGGSGLGFTAIGAIGGFILAMITIFSPQRAPITAPMYAVFEGLFLGGISAYYEYRYPGLVFQAIGLTMGIFLAMLAIYKSRIIPITNNFRLGVVAATGGVFLFYLASILLGYLGISLPGMSGGGLSIIVSVLVIGIASMNLVLDFDFIERAVEAESPKFMEWYAAFGLMVTLVWLYVEVLRLLSRSRD